MLLTHSWNLCFFFWGITQQYHEKFVYILAAVIVLSMFLSFTLRLVCHFKVIFFMFPSNNKRKLPANKQNLKRDPLSYLETGEYLMR